MSRVETLIDAIEVFKTNEELVNEVEKFNDEKDFYQEKEEKLKSMVVNLEKKNQFLIEFKTKSDAEILRLKKKNLSLKKW